MRRYILRRVAGLIPLFFGITVVTFFVVKLAPGKSTDLQAGLDPRISYEARIRLEELSGANLPVHIQYLRWLRDFVRFDFGRSMVDGRPVIDMITERIGITVAINVMSLILIMMIAIPIGIMASLKHGSLTDKLATIAVFIGFSTPGFWIALLGMDFFGIQLQLLPLSGIVSVDHEYLSAFGKVADVMKHLVLPVGISAFGGLAGLSRYTRSSMIGILQQDYITAARAKGLPEYAVIYKHALKNALLPIITILGLAIPGLIGGSVIIETVFAIPGMGRLFFESVMTRDITTIMGVLSIGAILTLIGNFLADISYSIADPRIRIADGGRRARS
ncbi:MAG: ABC transporter permease [Candidatus Omnitrophota bacterium]